MSNSSGGPGWWRASDGRWYPPEARPGPRRARGDGARAGDAEGAGRRPPGVPGAPPTDPKVQPPFTLRRVEPLELDREPARRRRRLDDDGRRIPWGWIGVVVLVLAFGGLGTWLAVTAGDQGEQQATPTTASTTEASAETTVPDTTTTTAAPTTTTAAEVSVFELDVGDCFGATPEEDDGEELVLTSVDLVDCGRPHLAEVVAVTRFRDEAGEPFPGAAARDADAQRLCQPAFEEYVGVPLSASELGLVWLAPTQETWEEDDDREVTCAAQSLDGEPLVDSVAGSER